MLKTEIYPSKNIKESYGRKLDTLSSVIYPNNDCRGLPAENSQLLFLLSYPRVAPREDVHSGQVPRGDSAWT